METYSVTFTITTELEQAQLQAYFDKLRNHSKTGRMSFVKMERWRPKGRPAVNQGAILEALETATKPLSNTQLQKKLDLNQKAVYYALRRLMVKGIVRYVKDEKYNVTRFYLKSREEELAKKLDKYTRVDFSQYDEAPHQGEGENGGWND
jgi:Fe2+ or Zn2+ uptake regulation protein